MRWRALLGRCIAGACFAIHASSFCAPASPERQIPAQDALQAAFAPWDDVQGLIASCINQAKRQILVQAYLLTNKKIADALLAAKRRGIDVQILADARRHSETPSSRLAALAAGGIGIWLETAYENAHNKVILIDPATPDATVITGSFNFTWTAQHRNAENILIVRRNPAIAERYATNWQRHRQEAVAFRK